MYLALGFAGGGLAHKPTHSMLGTAIARRTAEMDLPPEWHAAPAEAARRSERVASSSDLVIKCNVM